MDRFRYLTAQNSTASDVGLLILRVVMAVTFISYGSWHVLDIGISNLAENMGGAGVPLPQVAAPYLAYLELIGGFLLLPGVFSRLISAGLVVVMGGALIWVHWGEQIRMEDDGSGIALALLLGAVTLTMAIVGPGRMSVDHLITKRFSSPRPLPMTSATTRGSV